jgi:hypothetical protein
MRQPVRQARIRVTNRECRAEGVASRFPPPWRIVEIPNGFAVDDATGRQLGVFYGRADPNTAGHTGFLTIEEARQMAADFARLPELLKQPSRSQRGRESPASVRNAVARPERGDDPPRPERR